MGRYYPIMIDINNRLCTIVGGGKVAERKATSLLNYGAKVKIISLKITDKINDYFQSGIIELIKRDYQYGDLEGSFLVYAATDDSQTNKICAEECNKRGIILNVVDKPEMCDFIVPSVVKRGNLNINISTNGKSPMLSKRIRQDLEKIYPEIYSEYIDILGEIRDKVKAEVKDIHRRRNIFYNLVYSDVMERYLAGEQVNIKEELYNIYYKYRELDF